MRVWFHFHCWKEVFQCIVTLKLKRQSDFLEGFHTNMKGNSQIGMGYTWNVYASTVEAHVRFGYRDFNKGTKHNLSDCKIGVRLIFQNCSLAHYRNFYLEISFNPM